MSQVDILTLLKILEASLKNAHDTATALELKMGVSPEENVPLSEPSCETLEPTIGLDSAISIVDDIIDQVIATEVLDEVTLNSDCLSPDINGIMDVTEDSIQIHSIQQMNGDDVKSQLPTIPMNTIWADDDDDVGYNMVFMSEIDFNLVLDQHLELKRQESDLLFVEALLSTDDDQPELNGNDLNDANEEEEEEVVLQARRDIVPIGQSLLDDFTQTPFNSTQYHSFALNVIMEPFRTGFEENKDFNPNAGSVIANRYQVSEILGQAAFSSAYTCIDLSRSEVDVDQWVCLKIIKNNKDFFDQSLDEVKLLQYLNSHGDPNDTHILRLIDFFYHKEHLFIVSELLQENLYEFGKSIRDGGFKQFYTIERLQRISHQILTALAYIHGLGLIHCDIKPENIVIQSHSRCLVKLIDFGSSCFNTDHLTSYIQSRSYRAPEVILGCAYDHRIDVWSLGAVVAELFTGNVLFQNDSIQTMLSRIVAIVAPDVGFPDHMLNGHDASKYLTIHMGPGVAFEKCDGDQDGQLHHYRHDNNESGVYVIYPKKSSLKARLHCQDDDDDFVDFIAKCLTLDYKKRVTSSQALQHEWILRDYGELEEYNPS